MTITSHLLLAILAVRFDFKNLLSKKGGSTHKIIGWIWVIISLSLSIYFIRKKKALLHKIFMVGNFIFLTLVGIFTMLPERYIPETLDLY